MGNKRHLPFLYAVGLAMILFGTAIATADAPMRLSAMSRIAVKQFRFEGNTVFSQQELARVVGEYTGREITREQLESARRKLTEHYTARGYVNSGAVIPDQEVRDGVVRVRIVEGRLTAMKVTGNRWLRARYIEPRLTAAAGQPLNVSKLRDGLEVLRQNPNVEQVNAELRPGALPGESELSVRVRDRQPFWAALQLDNYRPASVGGEEIWLMAGTRNLTGYGDSVELAYAVAHGNQDRVQLSKLNNLGGAYTVPITVHETTLRIYGNKDDYAIIEEPFDTLDIKGESHRIGVALRQPLYRTVNRELALTLAFERHESRTFLLGQPFSITPGAVNGEEKVSVIRFAQEWVDRNPNQVLALRSTFSFGVNAFGVTDDGSGRDARFWAWLGQAQYVRRLWNTPNQFVFRTDMQWTDQPLLSLEQFALGGAHSVRGYRENQLVRDRGLYSGIELRLPVLCHKTGTPLLQLAPFVDFGAGWNARDDTPSPRSISSAGMGVLLTPTKSVQAQLYWGYAFHHFHPADRDLQDSGVHFQVRVGTF